MSDVQCPLCFDTLQVRDVTPCYICGGWTTTHSSVTYREWLLPTGASIVLCNCCEVEEFMTPFGWGHRLGLPKSRRLPIAALQLVRSVSNVEMQKDKYCPTCNLRLAFLRIVADSVTS
jgi:hypothetical protein